MAKAKTVMEEPVVVAVESEPTPEPITLTLDRKKAEDLYSLYKSLEAAEATYKACQSENFRKFAKSVVESRNIATAFAELKTTFGL